ncbi:hypothetical protein HZA97_05850 [Candidatus Woesearchaeota archaeon]|nr:hypothetical protein [Candidatus Woesearchaeota archaeon]
MNKRIRLLNCASSSDGLKELLCRYSKPDSLAFFIEDLVKEVKASALTDMTHASLEDAVADLSSVRGFLGRREITDRYGSLPRLNCYVSETENYLTSLLGKCKKTEVARTNSTRVSLFDDFLNYSNTVNYWSGESCSSLVLALCLENAKSQEEGLSFFNNKYASGFNSSRVDSKNIPVFGNSKTRDLQGSYFLVENTDLKIEFPEKEIRNSSGVKIGGYKIFVDFERCYDGRVKKLKKSMIGFEAYYLASRELNKTKVSEFKQGSDLLIDVPSAFKKIVELTGNLYDSRLPRQEVSKKMAELAQYNPEFHPDTEFFFGTGKEGSFKISVKAEGQVNHHTVRIKGEFKYN